MFKRVIWMGTGAAMGAGSAFWAKRKVVRTVERYLPDELARRAGASARTMGRTVRVAASEGRSAMQAREAELRAHADARTLVSARRRLTPQRPEPTEMSRRGRAVGAGGLGPITPFSTVDGPPVA